MNSRFISIALAGMVLGAGLAAGQTPVPTETRKPQSVSDRIGAPRAQMRTLAEIQSDPYDALRAWTHALVEGDRSRLLEHMTSEVDLGLLRGTAKLGDPAETFGAEQAVLILEQLLDGKTLVDFDPSRDAAQPVVGQRAWIEPVPSDEGGRSQALLYLSWRKETPDPVASRYYVGLRWSSQRWRVAEIRQLP